MRVTVSSVPFYTVSSSETNQREINLILYENAYIQTCVSICTVQSDRKPTKYPFIPNRLVYLTLLDRSISELKGVWLILFVIMFWKKKTSWLWRKQCRHWSDGAIRGVWTESTLFEVYIDPNLDFLRWAQIILLRLFCVLLPYNCELKGISASYADNPTMEYLSMEFLRSYANF